MSANDFRTSLHGVAYSETVAANPPRLVKTNSSTSTHEKSTASSPQTFYSAATISPSELTNGHSSLQSDQNGNIDKGTEPVKQPTPSSNLEHETFNTRAIPTVPSIPQIRVNSESEEVTPPIESPNKKWLSVRPVRSRTNSQNQETNGQSKPTQSFQGLALDIASGSWADELQTKNMEFSHRGSMLLDGRRVSPSGSVPASTLQRPNMGTQRIPTSSSVPERTPTRIMSTDEEILSEKVRAYYAQGSDAAEADPQSDLAHKMGSRWQSHLGADAESMITASRAPSTTDLSLPHSPSIAPSKGDNITREEMELAGGLEDWQDIDNADVDRYGFIIPKPAPALNGTPGVSRTPTVRGQGLQRVTTSLQLAAETPRRKRTIRRSSAEMANRSVSDSAARRDSSHSTRPTSSKSASIPHRSTFRAASNRLPGNRDRRVMDEAGDMFTLPRSMTAGPLTRSATMESDMSNKSKTQLETKATSVASRKKEMEREEKWRKMARPLTSHSKDPEHKGIGGGMLFSFPPPTDAKLISRTWKGIPDTWRAPAWHYFLSVSARNLPDAIPDDKLIDLFYEYQDINCPDDVQIDIDVPRTISSHIMFRRRYRGGQRLLFRVLHALSLHWPETGYVQGMAALAATLLSYYEEEKAFVMLVRLWECRGLGKLYKEGFGGLMEALNDFENSWLGEGEVAKKLGELNIFPTAYGTKWYLTLFNYSVPFPAQLRVWDVFMLLGDNTDNLPSATRPPTSSKTKPPPSALSAALPPSPEDAPFGSTLDILHATSAALIDGMRDILLESDFEGAMKVLTSWIPIRDEDLFMRVARAEWKLHRERRKKK